MLHSTIWRKKNSLVGLKKITATGGRKLWCLLFLVSGVKCGNFWICPLTYTTIPKLKKSHQPHNIRELNSLSVQNWVKLNGAFCGTRFHVKLKSTHFTVLYWASLTLQCGVTSAARHSGKISCSGVTSSARHGARSPHSSISTTSRANVIGLLRACSWRSWLSYGVGNSC